MLIVPALMHPPRPGQLVVPHVSIEGPTVTPFTPPDPSEPARLGWRGGYASGQLARYQEGWDAGYADGSRLDDQERYERGYLDGFLAAMSADASDPHPERNP